MFAIGVLLGSFLVSVIFSDSLTVSVTLLVALVATVLYQF